jgi:hypothetical protein
MDTETVFLFPPFRLNVRNQQLWRGSQAIALRPKTFAVLQYLVAHVGQVATQDALLDAVWGATAVSETVVRNSTRLDSGDPGPARSLSRRCRRGISVHRACDDQDHAAAVLSLPRRLLLGHRPPPARARVAAPLQGHPWTGQARNRSLLYRDGRSSTRCAPWPGHVA